MKKSFSLCKDCAECPVVTINNEQVTITDDFGGKVQLTTKELGYLVQKMTKEK